MDPLTEAVIKASFEVMNTLGVGFLENVYEAALYKELIRANISAHRQVQKKIYYKGDFLAFYVADLLVEDKLIVELKCADHLLPEHSAQTINYLKATGLTTALLINFKRSRLDWKRLYNPEMENPKYPIHPVNSEPSEPGDSTSIPAK